MIRWMKSSLILWANYKYSKDLIRGEYEDDTVCNSKE